MKHLLSRSQQLHVELVKYINQQVPFEDTFNRFEISHSLGMLSLEHARSVQLLLDTNMNKSAIALLRVQFESLVRGVWVLYCASDQNLSKYHSQSQNDHNIMLSGMLNKIQITAPPYIFTMLSECNAQISKITNSYIHSGKLSLQTYENESLLSSMIKISNNLVCLSSQLCLINQGITPKRLGNILNKYLDVVLIKQENLCQNSII